MGHPSIVESFCPRYHGSSEEGAGNGTRIEWKRRASKGGALASDEILFGFARQSVELSGPDVGFQLLLPEVRVELPEPIVKPCQLVGS